MGARRDLEIEVGDQKFSLKKVYDLFKSVDHFTKEVNEDYNHAAHNQRGYF